MAGQIAKQRAPPIPLEWNHVCAPHFSAANRRLRHLAPMPHSLDRQLCHAQLTNDAVFDDTLPLADGLLEAGNRVPLDRLQPAMEDWFRRKGYLKAGERLEVKEIG